VIGVTSGGVSVPDTLVMELHDTDTIASTRTNEISLLLFTFYLVYLLDIIGNKKIFHEGLH